MWSYVSVKSIRSGAARLAGAMVALASCATMAPGATIHVPADFPTVLAGVDAAGPGDSVLVGPGVWSEKDERVIYVQGIPVLVTACAFPQHGMTIVGTGGLEQTVLDGSGGGTTSSRVEQVAFYTPGPGVLEVVGFTFRDATASVGGAGITSSLSDGVNVRECRFVNNIAEPSSSHGAAVDIRLCDLEMSDCIVDSCESTGGIVRVLWGGLRMAGCEFTANVGKCVQVDNDGIIPFHVVVVEDSRFVRNRGSGLGVALDLVAIQQFEVAGSLFIQNVATSLGGAGVRAAVSVGSVSGNVFAFDSTLAAGTTGAGVRWEGSSGTVEANTFVGCHGVVDGSAISVSNSMSSLSLARNVVAFSTGGAAVRNIGPPLVGNDCNLYWSNAGGDFGAWQPSPTDLFVDPQFCNVIARDFTVAEESPCVTGPCAPIGAFGVGCTKVSITPMSWGRIKGLYRLER